MLWINKIECSGIVLLLLTTGISAPRPTLLPSGADPGKEVPALPHPNDVNKMQQTLLDQGHYRGKVDGVFGLRTRASIRGFQKAEKLPVTGQLDVQTAGKLGVKPELHQSAVYETAKGKPSAGIQSVKRLRRTNKALRMAVNAIAESESTRGRPQETGQGENEKRDQ
jgi:peptidoglycan hydrolase-like protein with peptidoglycan-binding domain